MLDLEVLKDIVHGENLSNKDRFLLCLAVNNNSPKKIAEIASIAKSIGLKRILSLNVSQYLTNSKGSAIRTDKGWELTGKGEKEVELLSGIKFNSRSLKVATDLRNHLKDISDKVTKEFVEQAIKCYEADLYRAAVVLSWVGAVSVLYEFIYKKKLSEFNHEAQRRDSKWKTATTKDDLSRMKEYDFLQVLNSISVIGKSVKEELESCLKFRNGCGHPNSLSIGETRVAAHIESLMLNVFSLFKS